MTYKQNLFFIAQCLTVKFEKKNKKEVLLKLKNKKIDWDEITKISTNHLVFSALYCNLKKVNFLKYLPKDLIIYMKYINNINEERNTQIIIQAKEINELLLSNNITPIFLKGTANILEGLYDNISERMIGDIDFICSKNEHQRAVKILLENGYYSLAKENYRFPNEKHYPRLKKKNRIAAVEIHEELISEKYRSEFNYNLVYKNTLKLNNINFLSYNHQAVLSIVSSHIDDYGFYYKELALKNAYDVFLISKKTDIKKTISLYKNLKNPMNCFLACCFFIFGNIYTLDYNKTKKAEKYLSNFDSLVSNDVIRKFRYLLKSIELSIQKRMSIIFKSITSKEHRVWLIKRISDKNWQKNKLRQIGLKK